jgi:divalent metal cation (Fe/Co/Zn/Cd) transporter
LPKHLREGAAILTIPIGGNPSLSDAHRLASDLEEALRQQVPAFADVVVHTEP